MVLTSTAEGLHLGYGAVVECIDKAISGYFRGNSIMFRVDPQRGRPG